MMELFKMKKACNQSLPPYKQIESNMVLTERRTTPLHHRLTIRHALQKLRNFCTTCTLVICLILLLLALVALAFKPLNKVIHVLLIETDKPLLFETKEEFLSVALDSSIIADGFQNFNMTNPKLLKLMTLLSPAYLRIGGTMADRLWFIPEEKDPTFKNSFSDNIDGSECAYDNIYCDPLLRPNFTMSGSEWLELNYLASNATLRILFDLNCLIRYPNGSWNSRNAEKLIEFSSKHQLNVLWELGNEPNAFKHVFNYEVNATQLATDFYVLRSILGRYPRYKNALLVGPDVTRPLPHNHESELYLGNFLSKAKNVVDAITWHQYYFNGKTASASDFLNPDIFDLLESQISIVKDVIRKAGVHTKPIWLGETSSAYGGGAPGYSNRYIGTFIWLDKLGVAARNGLSLVIRQSLFKGYYALIDNYLEPAPDWWISVIYKNLVGPEVVPCYSASSPMVRLYCHCTKNSLYSIVPSITVFGFNMQNIEARVRIQGHAQLDEGTTPQRILAYVLTPFMTLLSKHVLLNEEILHLNPNGDLPPLKPKIVEAEPYLVMPPYSLVFWIIPSPSAKYCFSVYENLEK